MKNIICFLSGIVAGIAMCLTAAYYLPESTLVHVVHVRLAHGRPFLDDLPRLNVLDVVDPSDFPVGVHAICTSVSFSRILYLKAIYSPLL